MADERPPGDKRPPAARTERPRLPVSGRRPRRASATPRHGAPGVSRQGAPAAPRSGGAVATVLHQTSAELSRRFGPPIDATDRAATFRDGTDPAAATLVHVMFGDDGTARAARLELAVPARMRPERIFEWVGRYNGGHVGHPELLPHTLAGGLRAWHFAGEHWAFPQKDEAGCIFGIKFWQEPL